MDTQIRIILDEYKEHVDLRIDSLVDKIEDYKSVSDQKFDNLSQKIEEYKSDTDLKIEEYKEEIKLHFNVVTERLEDKIKIVAEQGTAHSEKINIIEEKVSDINDTLNGIKLDIGYIKNNLDQKADRRELQTLEKRVGKLEPKLT